MQLLAPSSYLGPPSNNLKIFKGPVPLASGLPSITTLKATANLLHQDRLGVPESEALRFPLQKIRLPVSSLRIFPVSPGVSGSYSSLPLLPL